MKIGYTKNLAWLRYIARLTKNDTEYQDAHYSYDKLRYMGVDHFGVYVILLCLSDDDKYIGHAILNYSELMMGRVEVITVYISKEYRKNHHIFPKAWKEIEDSIKKLARDRQIRLMVHINSERKKFIKVIMRRCGMKRNSVILDYVPEKTYVQLYKLIGDKNG